MKYSFQQILDVLDKKRYTFYSSGIYNLNLIAVRSENSVSDSFDDNLYINMLTTIIATKAREMFFALPNQFIPISSSRNFISTLV